MSVKGLLLGSTQPTNAICACCSEGLLHIAGSGCPTEQVPDEKRWIVFCSQICLKNWQDSPHCAWCGKTERTTALVVKSTGTGEPDRHFCSVPELQSFRNFLAQNRRH